MSIAQMMNDIYRVSKYLYPFPEEYQEYNLLREQLQHPTPLEDMFQHVQMIHQNIVQRAQRQREINQQVISQNFNQLYPLAQLIFDTPGLERLEEKVENFIPTHYSMRNVAYSNQLYDEVVQIARQVYKHPGYGLNGDCPICLENLTSQQTVKYVPCNHLFHQSCAEAWDQTGITCPLCKQEFEGWIPI